MSNDTFSKIRDEIIGDTDVSRLILERHAIVLERVARGGGSTNWYYCRSEKLLQNIADRLIPGSLVSFYFDGRIATARFSASVVKQIERIVVDTGEVNAGALCDDQLQIDMQVLTGPREVAEFAVNRDDSDMVFYGVFPAPDNDGRHAISVTLPDRDGVVRRHPH